MLFSGAIRDLTDSYNTAFYLLTSCFAIIALFWSIELCYKKNKEKRKIQRENLEKIKSSRLNKGKWKEFNCFYFVSWARCYFDLDEALKFIICEAKGEGCPDAGAGQRAIWFLIKILILYRKLLKFSPFVQFVSLLRMTENNYLIKNCWLWLSKQTPL